MRMRLLAAGVMPLLLVAVAACGSSNDGKGVASVNGSAAAPGATPTLSLLDQGIRWAQCMRSHGVPQPDPVVANGDGIRFNGYNKDSVDAAAAQQAEQACNAYRPVLPAADQAFKDEFARQFARCMREQGVEGYPDPDPNGGNNQVSDAVHNDPQFPSAKETCDARERAVLQSMRATPTS